MNRLVKAEAYRLKRHLFFLVACSLACGFFPVISSINVLKEDLTTQLGSSGIIIMAVMMLFPPIFGGITGGLYDEGKLGLYEIMAGNKTSAIILSKILTDGMLFLVLTLISATGYYVVAGICHGVGSLDHMAVRALLIILTLAHVAFCSVLMVLFIQRLKSAAAMCFLRFWIVDLTVFPFLMWLTGSVLGWKELALHFSYMSLTNQLMILVSEPMHGMIAAHVLLGFAVEFAFWYILIAFRRRKG